WASCSLQTITSAWLTPMSALLTSNLQLQILFHVVAGNDVPVLERFCLGRHITAPGHDPEVELFLQPDVVALAAVAAIAAIVQSSDCAFGKPVCIQKGKNELIPIQTGTRFFQCLHDAA